MSYRARKQLYPAPHFSSVQEELLVNLERTTDQLRAEVQHLLKPRGLTATQYAALRILRESGEGGLTCSELGRQLVSSDPDITRLLDRLVKQGLAHRSRDDQDRRLVVTGITVEGVRRLEEITPALHVLMCRMLDHMPSESLRMLIDLLEEARKKAHELKSALLT